MTPQRLLPGRVDEPAGVDDDQVGLLARRARSAYPSCASSPSIRSESTRFLEQPRLTKLIVPLGL